MAKTDGRQSRRGGRVPARDALLREAELQTQAIMRLETWKRLAYSGLAVGAILVGWGFYGAGDRRAGVAGIALLVLSVPASVVLHLGIRNAKRNVDRMIEAYESEHGKVPIDPKSSSRRYA